DTKENHMTSHEAADSVNDVQQDSVPAVVQKPLLRGWIHLIATPVALIAGLIAVAQPAELYDRLSVAVFVLCSVVLFGASAVYHLGNWEPTRRAILRRIDHSNIYLLIAGTYTPLAVLLFEPDTRALLLGIICQAPSWALPCDSSGFLHRGGYMSRSMWYWGGWRSGSSRISTMLAEVLSCGSWS